MKIALLLTLFSVNTQAQELELEFGPPTPKDLMVVSMDLLKKSEEVMSKAPEKECDATLSPTAVVEEVLKEAKDDKEVFCFCDLDKEKNTDNKKETNKLMYALIGEHESSSLKTTTGNDNILHGAFQGNATLKSIDGNDRSRTFSGGIDYSLLGKDGELKLSYDSTGFSKLLMNSYIRDPEGKYFLNYHEVNTLGLRLDKNLSKDESQKTFFFS